MSTYKTVPLKTLVLSIPSPVCAHHFACSKTQTLSSLLPKAAAEPQGTGVEQPGVFPSLLLWLQWAGAVFLSSSG